MQTDCSMNFSITIINFLFVCFAFFFVQYNYIYTYAISIARCIKTTNVIDSNFIYRHCFRLHHPLIFSHSTWMLYYVLLKKRKTISKSCLKVNMISSTSFPYIKSFSDAGFWNLKRHTNTYFILVSLICLFCKFSIFELNENR